MYNPRYPAPVYAAPPGPLTLLSSAVTKLVSEMAMAGGLSESVMRALERQRQQRLHGRASINIGQLQGTLTLDANGGGTGGHAVRRWRRHGRLYAGAGRRSCPTSRCTRPTIRCSTCSGGSGPIRVATGKCAAASAARSRSPSTIRPAGASASAVSARRSPRRMAWPADTPPTPAKVGYIRGLDALKLSPAEYAKLLRPLDELTRTNRAEASRRR